MEEKIQPWHRQTDEPEAQFKMFSFYLNLGNKRSFDWIADTYNISKRTVASYSSKYNWTDRIRAYDKHMRKNYKFALIDFCRQLDFKKFNLKIELSSIILNIMLGLKSILENNEKLVNNDYTLNRIQFLDKISVIIQRFFNMIDFNLSPEMLRTKHIKEINIFTNMETNEKEPFVLNDEKNILLQLKTVQSFLKDEVYNSQIVDEDYTSLDSLNEDSKYLEQPEKNDENDANSNEESLSDNDTNDLQNS